ncbi:nitroreductase family protein [Clostridium folliculivorans]|uniref:Nitroreductase n=1 Tax=Clostridium folliculivorans TaxID=2886038 RepID=A0A9W6D8Z0_9CLOT|nr:nitroreductase family protein [Clostridium folliculivorans]GKU23775.1 nitroreductase [Clostridium folliculivorans]GKU29891.1 nitroreductase [Clostridium folliculivorans]
MSEAIKVLLNRRSTRVFKDEQIKDEELETILEAGKFAPSAINQQSWHFTVIQNKEVIDLLAETFKEVLLNSNQEAMVKRAQSANFKPYYNAPTLIIVSGDKSAVAPKADCGAATENLLLAAEAIGIGSCWLGSSDYIFNSPKAAELKEKLGIPETHEPLYSAIFGYKANDNAKAAPRKENTVNYIR